MDAKTFAIFLKRKLLTAADGYTEVLCSVTYDTLEKGNRLAGERNTLVGIAESLEDLLKEFYKERNN